MVSSQLRHTLMLSYERRSSNLPCLLCDLYPRVRYSVSYIFCEPTLTLRYRKSGLRDNMSRRCMSAVVLMMVISCTVLIFFNLELYIAQIPVVVGGGIEPGVGRKLVVFNICQVWLTRLNVSVSVFLFVFSQN